MSRKHLTLILVFLALLPALTACGWHLRGSAPGAASLEGVRLSLDSRVGRGELYREVYVSLQSSGVDLVPDAAGVPSLVLASESRQRRVISGTRADEVREYELRYRVSWQLRDGDGEELQSGTFEQMREYRRDEQQMLGGEGQEDAIVNEFRRDIAFLLADRLQALLGE